MNNIGKDWFCTNHRFWRLGNVTSTAIARLFTGLDQGCCPRLSTERWIRYHKLLSAPPTFRVDIVRIDDAIIERVRQHPEQQAGQIQSALRFWEHGLDHAYALIEHDSLLAIQWLLLPEQQSKLWRIPLWAGMYPPLRQKVGRLESLYVFREGYLRPGGAALDLAQGIVGKAHALGLEALETHIHVANLSAHRWARRMDFESVGQIFRCQADIRGLRRRYWYFHETCTIKNLVKADSNGLHNVRT